MAVWWCLQSVSSVPGPACFVPIDKCLSLPGVLEVLLPGRCRPPWTAIASFPDSGTLGDLLQEWIFRHFTCLLGGGDKSVITHPGGLIKFAQFYFFFRPYFFFFFLPCVQCVVQVSAVDPARNYPRASAG